MTIGVSSVEWLPAWRIIPSRFPPVGLFDRVADPADLDAVIALEGMTNDRIRDEVGNLQLIPLEERISGAGTSVIMAAFTHLNPQGSRFSDGSFGVCYVANTIDTCIMETRYHREKFLRATNEEPIEIDMRVYNIDLNGQLHDICGMQSTMPTVYHATDYSASKQFARDLKSQNASGILYNSVRHAGGFNAAVFRPRCLSNCRQERHLCYVWDGRSIAHHYTKSDLV